MREDDITKMIEERRVLVEGLSWFDANIWLGCPEGFPLAEEIEDISHIPERFITGGLVSHWRGKTVSAQAGNEAVLQSVRGNRRNLYGVWTGLPLFPPESGQIPGVTPTPPEVRAVRIFPKSHNFPLVSWCLGSLCKWLGSRHMPLFIWHTELDWPSLYLLAKEFPELAVVVESQSQKILYQTRPLFALMRDCPNVLLETSNFAGQGFIEYATREFGAERLIFGSFWPVNDPLAAIGMLIDAEISTEEKALIAGENLRRLISGACL